MKNALRTRIAPGGVTHVRGLAFLPERLRWRLWGAFCRLPSVCPATAHSLLIWRLPYNPFSVSKCRRDMNCGTCWCGKLRDPGAEQ